MSKETTIEVLERKHDRETFDCGVDALNHYLKVLALQHHKKNVSKTHVLTYKEGGKPILAYATLNFTEISTEGNEEHPGFKKLPRQIPALRLCRLAVSVEHQRKGIGGYMLGFVFAKAIEISNSVGCSGIIVDAKDKRAKKFYKLFGFVALKTDPMALYMPMKTIQDMAEKESIEEVAI